MTSSLKPITAVKCPITNELIAITVCDTCAHMIEVRRPWRHYIVECGLGERYEAIYE